MPSSAVSQIGSARTRFTPDSPARRRATRGGMLGNYVDQVDIFLPVIALAPVSDRVLGPGLRYLAGRRAAGHREPLGEPP